MTVTVKDILATLESELGVIRERAETDSAAAFLKAEKAIDALAPPVDPPQLTKPTLTAKFIDGLRVVLTFSNIDTTADGLGIRRNGALTALPVTQREYVDTAITRAETIDTLYTYRLLVYRGTAETASDAVDVKVPPKPPIDPPDPTPVPTTDNLIAVPRRTNYLLRFTGPPGVVWADARMRNLAHPHEVKYLGPPAKAYPPDPPGESGIPPYKGYNNHSRGGLHEYSIECNPGDKTGPGTQVQIEFVNALGPSVIHSGSEAHDAHAEYHINGHGPATNKPVVVAVSNIVTLPPLVPSAPWSGAAVVYAPRVDDKWTVVKALANFPTDARSESMDETARKGKNTFGRFFLVDATGKPRMRADMYRADMTKSNVFVHGGHIMDALWDAGEVTYATTAYVHTDDAGNPVVFDITGGKTFHSLAAVNGKVTANRWHGTLLIPEGDILLNPNLIFPADAKPPYQMVSGTGNLLRWDVEPDAHKLRLYDKQAMTDIGWVAQAEWYKTARMHWGPNPTAANPKVGRLPYSNGFMEDVDRTHEFEWMVSEAGLTIIERDQYRAELNRFSRAWVAGKWKPTRFYEVRLHHVYHTSRENEENIKAGVTGLYMEQPHVDVAHWTEFAAWVT